MATIHRELDTPSGLLVGLIIEATARELQNEDICIEVEAVRLDPDIPVLFVPAGLDLGPYLQIEDGDDSAEISGLLEICLDPSHFDHIEPYPRTMAERYAARQLGYEG